MRVVIHLLTALLLFSISMHIFSSWINNFTLGAREISFEHVLERPTKGHKIDQTTFVISDAEGYGFVSDLISIFSLGLQRGNLTPEFYLQKGYLKRVKGYDEYFIPVSLSLEIPVNQQNNLFVSAFAELGDIDYHNKGLSLGYSRFLFQRMTEISFSLGYDRAISPSDYYLNLLLESIQHSGVTTVRKVSVGIKQIMSKTMMGKLSWSMVDQDKRPYGYLIKTRLIKALTTWDSSVMVGMGYYVEEKDLKIDHRYGVLNALWALVKYNYLSSLSVLEDWVISVWFRYGHEIEQTKMITAQDNISSELINRYTSLLGLRASIPVRENHKISIGTSQIDSNQDVNSWSIYSKWQVEL